MSEIPRILLCPKTEMYVFTCGPFEQTVNTESRVLFGNLSGLNFSQGADGGQTGVLSQGQRNAFQSVGESSEWILFQCFDLEISKKKHHESPYSSLTGQQYFIRKYFEDQNSFSLEHFTNLVDQIFTESAAFDTAMAQAISGAPPPQTIRLSRTRLRTTQMASWILRLASSTI